MRPVYTFLPAVAAIGAATPQPSDSWVFGNIAVVNGKVVQTVTMEGKVISKQSDNITNLTGTLSEADTKFANVMKLDNVTESTFMSTDSGITWHTDRITTSRIDFDSSSDTMVN
ncbi:hypothetical protein PENSUB_13888 [Penicillium subrubescens]|uniref:Uncharacterized protein n=1 Tax=Penicillium subrubescens TaxID=1316194 RepID=A0A1Q5UPY9_9EURO|nr:hypothetical protein PENSUB_13888 [Penicillium subrubescens]